MQLNHIINKTTTLLLCILGPVLLVLTSVAGAYQLEYSILVAILLYLDASCIIAVIAYIICCFAAVFLPQEPREPEDRPSNTMATRRSEDAPTHDSDMAVVVHQRTQAIRATPHRTTTGGVAVHRRTIGASVSAGQTAARIAGRRAAYQNVNDAPMATSQTGSQIASRRTRVGSRNSSGRQIRDVSTSINVEGAGEVQIHRQRMAMPGGTMHETLDVAVKSARDGEGCNVSI